MIAKFLVIEAIVLLAFLDLVFSLFLLKPFSNHDLMKSDDLSVILSLMTEASVARLDLIAKKKFP